jgi:hypothetical protein
MAMKRGPKVDRGYDPIARRWDRPAPVMWHYKKPLKMSNQVVAGFIGCAILIAVITFLASGCWGECL